MTPDEMKKKLKEMGLDFEQGSGKWSQKKKGIDVSKMESVQKFAKVAEQMQSLLEKQVEKDQATLEALHEQLKRFQHGGGQ